MVYCFPDIHPTNFILDINRQIVIVDFEQASILPASFALHFIHSNRLGFDITDMIDIPGASFENVKAMAEASRRITFSSSAFSRIGRDVEGGDADTQKRLGSLIQT